MGNSYEDISEKNAAPGESSIHMIESSKSSESRARGFFLSLLLFGLLLSCSELVPPDPVRFVTIRGIVKDRSTLAALPNAIVRAVTSQVEDTTDENGLFELRNIRTGTELLRVVLAGYDTTVQDIIVREQNDDIAVLLGGSDNQFLYVTAGHTLYVVDADRQMMIDSLDYAPSTFGVHMAMSPGGSRLFLTRTASNGSLTSIAYLDTKTRTFHETSVPAGWLHASYDGKIIVNSTSNIWITDTLATAYEYLSDVSITSPFCILSPTQPILYCTRGDKLLYFNYQSRAIVDSLILRLSDSTFVEPIELEITPDGEEIFSTTASGYLAVFNLGKKTVDLIMRVNRIGDVAVTPDGGYALVTDPACFAFGEIISGWILIANRATRQYDGLIDVNPVADENNCTDRMAITQSGGWAFVSDAGSKVFLLDLKSRTATKAMKFFPVNSGIGGVILGNKISQ